MFEQAFKNIDDILWKEAGCTTELDYTGTNLMAAVSKISRWPGNKIELMKPALDGKNIRLSSI